MAKQKKSKNSSGAEGGTSSNSKGAPGHLLSADQHNARRRAVKAGQRAGRGGNKRRGGGPTVSILDAVRKDQLDEQNRRRLHTEIMRVARRKWDDVELLVFVNEYTEALCGLRLDYVSILAHPYLDSDQQATVQRYFAQALVVAKYPPSGTPGEDTEWFAEAFRVAERRFGVRTVAA